MTLCNSLQGASSSSRLREEALRTREMNAAIDRRAAQYGLSREQFQQLQDSSFASTHIGEMGPVFHRGDMFGVPPVRAATMQENVQAIRNDVHLVKGSLHFTADGEAASRLHLQFFIDAATPVAVLVLYCASPVNDGELLSCVSTPVAYSTTRVVLPAGSHQLFNQKDTGDALDLALFPDPLLFEGHDVPWSSRSSFPVMVVLESVGEAEVGSRTTVDMVPGPGLDMRPKRGAKLQITLASLTPPKAGGLPGVHLLAQKLQILGHSFCVEEIYGLASQSPPSSGAAPAAAVSGGSTAAADNLDDGSAECVICLSQRRDTVCFPCRHLCLCSECASTFRLQSNKCPICRAPVTELMQLKRAAT